MRQFIFLITLLVALATCVTWQIFALDSIHLLPCAIVHTGRFATYVADTIPARRFSQDDSVRSVCQSHPRCAPWMGVLSGR